MDAPTDTGPDLTAGNDGTPTDDGPTDEAPTRRRSADGIPTRAVAHVGTGTVASDPERDGGDTDPPGRDPPPESVSEPADRDRSIGPAIDPANELDRATSFVRETVSSADADGVVVNMSGGLDSTVTASIAVEALGPERVYGLILPRNKLGAHHARDAEALADALGIEHDTVHLQPLFAGFGDAVPDRFDFHDDPALAGNAVARLRMTLAYLAANAMGRLVPGTTNRSERLLGYFTKHGDGAADLLPIGHLYKTEVRAVADALDVPEFVVEKPPTAGFFAGQRDADELGADYATVDRTLRLGVDEGLDPEAVASRIDADEATVARLLDRHRATDHKRSTPSTPPTPADRGPS